MGPDGFDGAILFKSQEIMTKVSNDLAIALNSGKIPDFLKISRVIPLSKRKGSAIASLDEIRTIAVGSHLMRIIEKAILAKLTETRSTLLNTRDYQSGFRAGMGTHRNMTAFLASGDEYKALIDLTRAFDFVDRQLLKNMLASRCKNEADNQIARLISCILTDS